MRPNGAHEFGTVSDSAKTYVACRERRVVGYYALAAGSVHKHESPDRIAKGLANHPVRIVLLARLAVTLASKAEGWERRSCPSVRSGRVRR